ncbi:hypothetical protein Poli38472_009303 [Pythium oligandrum]|uniref:Uncharacterized protein n=1 Tax=Pythium oligandrum TaxID=41045 RepID=A0A8K1CK74_PYTOL|nr:hypothetical protein Poli38472_009303 [Pythium oligandrum]|eukprot:TMW65136.1 hypothetical protein Poli38472_009303 [Pythium oligandrum]
MEGVLWVRKRRSKLLRTWQKRYLVLTRDGVLKEYAEATGSKHKALTIAGSGMVLKHEFSLRGASVAKLPFPMAGRPYAFRIKQSKSLKITMAAKSSSLMDQWIRTLKDICGVEEELFEDGGVERSRSPAVCGGISRHGAMSSPFRLIELPGALPRTSEQEFTDLKLTKGDDVTRLWRVCQWESHRLRTRTDWSIGATTMTRGSMVVAVNGISLQTLSEEEVRTMLKPSRVPLTLRCLKNPYKRGMLKCKLCYGLTTQLKTIAMYRNGLRQWKDQIVEIDGDVLTCQPKKADGKESNKSVIPLVGGCTVKPVHEIVADQQYCFVVSVKAYSMLFQAATEEEMLQWTDAIQRAVNIAEGCTPGLEISLDTLQLESSVNMRRHGDNLLIDTSWDDDGGEEGAADSASESTGDDDSEFDVNNSPSLPYEATLDAQFSDDQLSGMLEFLQSKGRFIEALQLMATQPSQRSSYWMSVFRWAMDPIEDFAALLEEPLHHADATQVQKDVPRTSKWLAGSAGAPQLSGEATAVRLRTLETVLHAFLVSCKADKRTDAGSGRLSEGGVTDDHRSFYMQGMNGIAYLILDVVDDQEVVACQMLRGVVTHILPHVFGIRSVDAGGENFDLFGSLIEVGNVLDEVVQMHLPNFHDAMEKAGLPVCLLAYKWFPTLFSDISLMAHRSQLRYDTLLAIWDVCLLMGVEGMFCVALALFSAAEEAVISLRANPSTELVTGTIITVLSSIEPHDLMISVCEVLELCSHPVLLKLRNGHRRRLLQVSQQRRQAPRPQATATEPSVSRSPEPAIDMTVRDLDSGKLFQISKTGSMLLPVKPVMQAE